MVTTRKNMMYCLLLVVFCICTYAYYQKTHKEQTETTKGAIASEYSDNSISTTTSISVTEKTKATDADLKLSQTYTAEINGKVVTVPVVSKATSATDSASDTATAKAPQATIKQTIDLTPLLSELRPTWEIGVGYGKVDGVSYIPLSVQRNYARDKAIEITVPLSLSENLKVKGAVVTHKWLIK
jgi:hypothetical protein